jgi:hypothetical protein
VSTHLQRPEWAPIPDSACVPDDAPWPAWDDETAARIARLLDVATVRLARQRATADSSNAEAVA